MELIPIGVGCYSGYKADEYPEYFIMDEIRYEISRIIDRWYQKDVRPNIPASDYFRVETTSGMQLILKHNLERDAWYACHPSHFSEII